MQNYNRSVAAATGSDNQCKESKNFKEKYSKRKDDLSSFTDYMNNLVDMIPKRPNDPNIAYEYEKINSNIDSVNERLKLNEKSKNFIRNKMNKLHEKDLK